MKLTLVGLPLGNIQDISLRALNVLQRAEYVICEDTRVFYKLWQKLVNLGYLSGSFTGKLTVINEYNEKAKADLIINDLSHIEEGILVSDAGQPGFSDPGFVLVQKVIEVGGVIDIIPGPTAAMSALALSGFSPDRVLYLGFLPKRTSKRNKNWEQIKILDTGLSIIIYESPLRVSKTLKEVHEKLGNIPTVVVRELTKEHQEVIRGTASELLAKLQDKPLKGEVVLLLRT